MSRPVKYTPALCGKICGSVASGEPVSVACRIAGISRGTLYNWLREYPDFATQLEIAEGQRIASRLQKLESKAERDWRADAWILERTSEEFREVKDVRIQVEQGVASALDAARPHMSVGAWNELIRALAVAAGMAEGAPKLTDGDDS